MSEREGRMNEQIKEWLLEMYNEEIVQEEGTIENERVWADGATDAQTRTMHEANVAEHRTYLAVLRDRRARVAEEGV